ncbi:MAG: enoyl-ACP reductase FabI [Rhodospirillales bacterium]|jgi:enoyl-[acyl-carrier protein] reductase I|nr:enoyl-ACP reductase FabI [Rhodospirillales bacterium]
MNDLMKGKRGVIMGVANDHSIAWGIASALAAQGAELAFTFQGGALEKRVRPLVESVGSDLLVSCDVEDDSSIENAFETIGKKWDSIDFVVHAIAYSDKDELNGRYVETSRDNFKRTLDVSCFSFTSTARVAAGMMADGGSMLTLTFAGSQRVVPNYNVMGVAKAALEASVRYLASDLGDQGIRVNAISAGPVRTLAGSAISGARHIYRWSQENAPLKRNADIEDIGGSALYLLSELSNGVTGEVHHVDSGYNIVGIPEAEK